MSDSGKAVFLSYASQDAEAVRRIAEALRASGVEVWFDQNELVGGDAWDAKIRKQIAECALFVPVISANTQARLEGYFRIEWKLAALRTHAMADAKPFLMPVVIDDTVETVAHVPGEFRAVQWTRFRHAGAGESTVRQASIVSFCARVGHLLAEPIGETDSSRSEDRASPARTNPPDPKIHERSLAVASPVAPFARPRWLMPASGGTLLILAGIAAFILLQRKHPPAAESPLVMARASVAAPRLGVKSIAVLPFDNLSEDKEANAFFAEGVHEDVITNLLLIRELRCVPRATVVRYLGSKKTNREIAEELGVAFVLNGTVRRADKKVRITATLIDPRTDDLLWTKSYTKDLTEVVFAIQSELAETIATELKTTLSPEEKKLLGRRFTENAAAYDLFLRGRQMHTNNQVGSDWGKMEALLQAAVTLDPTFALAWSELSWVGGYAYYFGHERSPERLEKATKAIETAVRLAPDDPEVILNQGYFYLLCVPDYARANELFARAVRLQPGSSLPLHAIGSARRREGRWLEALESYRSALRLDPGFGDAADQVFACEQSGRRYPEALAAEKVRMSLRNATPSVLRRNQAEINFRATGSLRDYEEFIASPLLAQNTAAFQRKTRNDFALARGDLTEFLATGVRPAPATTNLAVYLPTAAALVAQGRADEARTLLAPFPELLRTRLQREPFSPFLWADLGMVEAILGHAEEALRCVRKAVELVPDSVDRSFGPVWRIDLAFVQAWTGDKAAALEEYRRLLQVPNFNSSNAHFSLTLNAHVMRHHPFFFPLQGDPRFEALLNDPKNNAPLF